MREKLYSIKEKQTLFASLFFSISKSNCVLTSPKEAENSTCCIPGLPKLGDFDTWREEGSTRMDPGTFSRPFPELVSFPHPDSAEEGGKGFELIITTQCKGSVQAQKLLEHRSSKRLVC